MQFVTTEVVVHFGRGHFDDDFTEIECSAKSFAEAREKFRAAVWCYSGEYSARGVDDPQAVYDGEQFFMDELSKKLGVHIEWDTDLDELIAEMEQGAAEDEWIETELSMFHGRE